MTNQHPITPPPELVEQWAEHILRPEEGNLALDLDWFANQAARWGSDQELEACCGFIGSEHSVAWSHKLRTNRRPKPPTLKEQALDELASAERLYPADWSTIRKALEALSND